MKYVERYGFKLVSWSHISPLRGEERKAALAEAAQLLAPYARARDAAEPEGPCEDCDRFVCVCPEDGPDQDGGSDV